jgi:hypothetical protein
MVHNAKPLSVGQIIFLAIELRKIPVTTSNDAVANSMESVSVLLRQGDTSVYIFIRGSNSWFFQGPSTQMKPKYSSV